MRRGNFVLNNQRVLASCGLMSMVVACSLLGGQPIPDWIEGTSRVFSNEAYIVGRGEAGSREVAEQRAYAAVARIFRAKVEAQLRDTEVYSQLEQQNTTTMSRRLTLDHLTQVSTEKVLQDVQILDSWRRKEDRMHFVLAGLNRAKTERMLRKRITDYDTSINMNVERGRNGKDTLTKLRGLKRALRDLRLREVVNADMQIVRLTGAGLPPRYSVETLQKELDEFLLDDVLIEVSITGDQREQVRQAVWEGLQREGFVIVDQHASARQETIQQDHPDLRIIGTTRLDDLTLFDPLFKYARWCSDLQIIESHGQRLIGVVSRSGREGHITQQEARVKATHAMQEAVSTDIAHSLASYIYDDDQREWSSPSSCLSE